MLNNDKKLKLFGYQVDNRSMSQLNQDVWNIIINMLDWPDVYSLERTCKILRKLALVKFSDMDSNIQCSRDRLIEIFKNNHWFWTFNFISISNIKPWFITENDTGYQYIVNQKPIIIDGVRSIAQRNASAIIEWIKETFKPDEKFIISYCTLIRIGKNTYFRKRYLHKVVDWNNVDNMFLHMLNNKAGTTIKWPIGVQDMKEWLRMILQS